MNKCSECRQSPRLQFINASRWGVGALVMLLMMAGCGEFASSYDDRPEGSKEILTDDELEVLAEAGVEVHVGDNPPVELEGRWYLDQAFIAYDEVGLEGSNRADIEYHFFDVEGDEIEFEWHHPNLNVDSVGSGAFISGEDGCFTIYAGATTDTNGCITESADVLSGCMVDSNTIKNFQMAFMYTEKSGNQASCEQVIPVDTPRIIENRTDVKRVD